MDVFIDIGENFSVPWFVCNGYSRFTLLRKDGKWLIEKVEIDNNILFRMLNKKEFRTVSNEELFFLFTAFASCSKNFKTMIP